MKRILLTTAAVFALTGMAHAQTVTATPGQSLVNDSPELAKAESAGEKAIAVTKFLGGSHASRAEVGNSVVAKASGDNGTGLSGAVVVGANVNNLSGILQIGTGNSAVNMQVGNQQESAMFQLGDSNTGVISQTTNANEAALAQVGTDNDTVLVQNGVDNASAATAWGDNNMALGLQDGNLNMLAIAQEHDDNKAVTLQDGTGNTAATVQDGSDNMSFISQGAGTSFSLAGLAGAGGPYGYDLPAGMITGSVMAMGATGNAAASLQESDGNSSAIVQTGSNNTAINYQN